MGEDKKQTRTNTSGSIRSLLDRIVTGPGTVPTSNASVSVTSIEELIKTSKNASKLGVFDTDQKEHGSK